MTVKCTKTGDTFCYGAYFLVHAGIGYGQQDNKTSFVT